MLESAKTTSAATVLFPEALAKEVGSSTVGVELCLGFGVSQTVSPYEAEKGSEPLPGVGVAKAAGSDKLHHRLSNYGRTFLLHHIWHHISTSDGDC